MARIIRKGHQLEEAYYTINQTQTDRDAQAVKRFGKIALVSVAIYIAAVAVSIAAGLCSTMFIPLSVCLGAVLIIAVFVYLSFPVPDYVNADILITGIKGERIAAKVLSALPDSYIVFQDVVVTYDGKASEIDNIVVGKSGVFIVEVKNHNGRITGDCKDVYWIQHKVGRGGTPYTEEIYSPVKQVGTHIYRLANYLRKNGVNTYVEGMVYFTNPSCVVRTTGDGAISIYSSFDSDEKRLRRRILSGNHNLDSRSIKHICKLINQL